VKRIPTALAGPGTSTGVKFIIWVGEGVSSLWLLGMQSKLFNVMRKYAQTLP